MNTSVLPATQLQLRTLISQAGELNVHLIEGEMPVPSSNEVLIRIEAVPVNPSDVGRLLSAVKIDSLRSAEDAPLPAVHGELPQSVLPSLAARLDKALPAGNEGAGVVVAAGDSPEAQALLGRTVAIFSGKMYQQYCTARAVDCLVLAEGTSPADAASSTVNPLTALGMVETMRAENHTAIVHTVGASNLGQMLNRICIADGVGLVNIVRSSAQAELLREQGATWVVDSSEPNFEEALYEAIKATGATIAFDAIGGGNLASQILEAMELALLQDVTHYGDYGSPVHKQVYVYGRLDRSPMPLRQSYGMAWGVGGWLLTYFLQKTSPDELRRLRAHVVAELHTTFRSGYSEEISLSDMLQLDNMRRYARPATGQKFLVNPTL